MTNSQKTQERIQEKVAQTDDPCCDDSCCASSGPSVSFESEGRRRGGVAKESIGTNKLPSLSPRLVGGKFS